MTLQDLDLKSRAQPTIVDLVQMLLQRAGEIQTEAIAAERLVERTLQLAIDDPLPVPAAADLHLWLSRLMDLALQRGRSTVLN